MLFGGGLWPCHPLDAPVPMERNELTSRRISAYQYDNSYFVKFLMPNILSFRPIFYGIKSKLYMSF